MWIIYLFPCEEYQDLKESSEKRTSRTLKFLAGIEIIVEGKTTKQQMRSYMGYVSKSVGIYAGLQHTKFGLALSSNIRTNMSNKHSSQ